MNKLQKYFNAERNSVIAPCKHHFTFNISLKKKKKQDK